MAIKFVDVTPGSAGKAAAPKPAPKAKAPADDLIEAEPEAASGKPAKAKKKFGRPKKG